MPLKSGFQFCNFRFHSIVSFGSVCSASPRRNILQHVICLPLLLQILLSYGGYFLFGCQGVLLSYGVFVDAPFSQSLLWVDPIINDTNSCCQRNRVRCTSWTRILQGDAGWCEAWVYRTCLTHCHRLRFSSCPKMAPTRWHLLALPFSSVYASIAWRVFPSTLLAHR